MSVSNSDPIVIVGAGAFGLSTALHLYEDGFSDITVVEKDAAIPSRFSAANDLNKIVRAEYDNEFYTDLTLKAIEAWQTPLFAPHFHQVGFLHCVSSEAPQKAVNTLLQFQNSAEGHPQIKQKVLRVGSAQDIRDLVWQYKRSSLPGWRGYLNRLDGYAHSANALKTVHQALSSKGVKFILGHHGTITNVVYQSTREGKYATGVKSKTDRFYPAKVIIVAAGAGSSKIIPEIGRQLVAKSWSVAHVHLSDDETSHLRGIPVTYARDLGFLFEPDPKTNLLKLCPMGGGYINTDPNTGVSYAPETLEESAFMPFEDELRVRKLLLQALPSLADRPLVKKSLCWFADTRDSEFIIDYVPGTSSSVVLLSGDSGHGFKMFPIVGSWVKQLLQAPDGIQQISRWRWKNNEVNELSSNWGGDVSWRLGESKELAKSRAEPRPRL